MPTTAGKKKTKSKNKKRKKRKKAGKKVVLPRGLVHLNLGWDSNKQVAAAFCGVGYHFQKRKVRAKTFAKLLSAQTSSNNTKTSDG